MFAKDERPSKTVRTRPTQGDWVLIREMDTNRPDMAQKASEHALKSDPDTEEDDGPLDLNERHEDSTSTTRRAMTGESSTHSHMQTEMDQQPAAMSRVGMENSKSLNHGAKAKRTPKRSVIVTQDPPKPQERISSSKDEKDNENTPVHQEHSQEKRKEPTGHSGTQRGGHDQAFNQRTPKRFQARSHSFSSRPSSPRSDVAVDGRSDAGSLSSRNTTKDDTNNEIRLRVDANAPLSLQFTGDMESRTMQLVPTEEGMADLVISGGRETRNRPFYRTHGKGYEAGLARHRRLSAHLPPIEAGDHQDSVHTEHTEHERAERARNREERNSKVYHPPTVLFEDTSDEYYDEDEAPAPTRLCRLGVDNRRQKEPGAIEYINSRRPIDVPLNDRIRPAAKRHPSTPFIPGSDDKEETGSDSGKQGSEALADSGRPRFVPSQSARDVIHPFERIPPSRRPVITYHTAPRSTSGPGYPSGPAIIQPAVGRRPRRPTETGRPISFSGEPGQQYHWSHGPPGYPPYQLVQTRYSTSSSRQGRTYAAEPRSNIERTRGAHADKERPHVSLYPVHTTTNQTPSFHRDKRQDSMLIGQNSGSSALSAQPKHLPLSPLQLPIPSQHGLQLGDVPADDYVQRDDEPRHRSPRVRFSAGRAYDRARARAETLFTEREKERVMTREANRRVKEEARTQQEKKDLEQIKAEDRKKEKSSPPTVSEPCPPPTEIQYETPTGRSSSGVSTSTKPERNRSAHYDMRQMTSMEKKNAEYTAIRNHEQVLSAEAKAQAKVKAKVGMREEVSDSSIGNEDTLPHAPVDDPSDIDDPVRESIPHAASMQSTALTSSATACDPRAPKPCTNCFTQTTPLWRRDPEGHSLCDVCGLFLKLHGVVPPVSLNTDIIEKHDRRHARVKSPRPRHTVLDGKIYKVLASKISLQSPDKIEAQESKTQGAPVWDSVGTSYHSAFESLGLLSDAENVLASEPRSDVEVIQRGMGATGPASEHDSRTTVPKDTSNQEPLLGEKLAELVEESHSLYRAPPTSNDPLEQQRRPLGMRIRRRQAFDSCTDIDALGETVADGDVVDAVGLDDPSNSSAHDHGVFDTWSNAGAADDHGVNFEWDYGDSMSGPSSYAASIASVFSVASLASSASDMSRGSGYSAVQIATATKVLLAIFYEDDALLSLYKSAIENQTIGPERLQRNLRRLFRAYASLLENEATERLEYLTSRLVLIKSAMLAQSIIEKLQSGRAGFPLPRRERNEESSDEEENSADARPVNEDAFEDLATFREFLVDSDAFNTFRVQLEAFVIPKSTHLTHLESARSGVVANATTGESTQIEAIAGHKETLTSQKWRDDSKQSADAFFGGAHWKTMASSIMFLTTDALTLATDDVMIAAGLLEPPLRPDMVRLRWQCVCILLNEKPLRSGQMLKSQQACGESLHSDMAELRKGGIGELVDHMRRTSGAKVRASAHNHQSGNQQYIVPHPIQWIRRAVTSLFGGSTKKSSSCLPQHNIPCTVTTSAGNPQPQQSILYLLACMHRNRLRKILQQERIEDVATDRALLCFLRKQYLRHRGRFLHVLSLKSVKGISFVKFRLPIGGSVDVRHHDPCCVTNNTGQVTCECIPPPPKVEPSPGAEYRCIPGPPATYPPIPPVYLASLFTCPTDVHEKDTWILDQLPKRTCGELRGQIGQPAEGWGIYYDEGLDRDTLALTVLVVFLVASLLFGVLWSRFQYDVQGAFGVSAYMVACCAVLLPVIVTRLENKG